MSRMSGVLPQAIRCLTLNPNTCLHQRRILRPKYIIVLGADEAKMLVLVLKSLFSWTSLPTPGQAWVLHSPLLPRREDAPLSCGALATAQSHKWRPPWKSRGPYFLSLVHGPLGGEGRGLRLL